MNQSIETLLVKSQMVVTKIKTDSNIAQALDSMGYNEETLHKGSLLIEQAKKIQQGDHDDLFDKIDDANYVFRRHVKLARIVFIEKEDVWNQLNLNGSGQYSAHEWIKKAKEFYQILINNNAYLMSLIPFGVDKVILETSLAVITNLEGLITKRNKVSPEVVERDQAIDDLNNWMVEFELAARKALRTSPHELHSLGVY
ncbi:MAG: hypothetical protein OCD76_06970 [Reichenbachiella sp.]